MKINKELSEYIYQLSDMMENNILAADFFNEHFYNWTPSTDIAYFESFVGEGLIKELLLDLEGLNEEDVDEEFMNLYLIPAVKEVNKEEIRKNHYYFTCSFSFTIMKELFTLNYYYSTNCPELQ